MSKPASHILILAAGLAAGAWLGQPSLTNPPTLPKSESRNVLSAPSTVEEPVSLDSEPESSPQFVGTPWSAFETPGGIFAAMQAYLTWLEARPVGELGETLSEYADSVDTMFWRDTLTLFHLAHWADSDFEAALAHTTQLPEDASLHALAIIHSARVRSDPDGALASAAKQPRSQDVSRRCLQVRNFYHPRFDLSWATQVGIDPAEHLRLWLRRGESPHKVLESALSVEGLSSADRKEAITSLFRQTASIEDMNFERARALVDQIPEKEVELRAAAREGLLDGWGSHRNPLTALKAVHALTGNVSDLGASEPMPPPGTPAPFSSKRFHEAMSAYPNETIRWLLEDLDRETRVTALSKIYSMSGSGRTEQIGWLKLYRALPAEERLEGRLTFHVRNLSHERPRELLDWLAEFPMHELGEERNHWEMKGLASAAAKSLALQNPDEALARLETMDEGVMREAVAKGLIEHFSRTRPELARNLFDELPDDADRQTAQAGWLGAYAAREGLEAGIDYLEDIDDPAVRERFVDALVQNPTLSPTEVAQLVDLYGRDREDPLSRTHVLMEMWAESDPDAAGEWFMTYQDSPSFPERIERLMERWRFQDFDAAVAFAQSLPEGKALDAAISHLTGLAQDVDPHAALQWQARMSDPEKRLHALEQGLIRVDERAGHPGEMGETLDSLPISEPEREVLRERLDA